MTDRYFQACYHGPGLHHYVETNEVCSMKILTDEQREKALKGAKREADDWLRDFVTESTTLRVKRETLARLQVAAYVAGIKVERERFAEGIKVIRNSTICNVDHERILKPFKALVSCLAGNPRGTMLPPIRHLLNRLGDRTELGDPSDCSVDQLVEKAVRSCKGQS